MLIHSFISSKYFTLVIWIQILSQKHEPEIHSAGKESPLQDIINTNQHTSRGNFFEANTPAGMFLGGGGKPANQEE